MVQVDSGPRVPSCPLPQLQDWPTVLSPSSPLAYAAASSLVCLDLTPWEEDGRAVLWGDPHVGSAPGFLGVRLGRWAFGRKPFSSPCQGSGTSVGLIHLGSVSTVSHRQGPFPLPPRLLGNES